jgi:hypothetical protein
MTSANKHVLLVILLCNFLFLFKNGWHEAKVRFVFCIMLFLFCSPIIAEETHAPSYNEYRDEYGEKQKPEAFMLAFQG